MFKDLLKLVLNKDGRKFLANTLGREVIAKEVRKLVERNTTAGAKLKIVQYIQGRLGVHKGSSSFNVKARAEIVRIVDDAFEPGKPEETADRLANYAIDWLIDRLP